MACAPNARRRRLTPLLALPMLLLAARARAAPGDAEQVQLEYVRNASTAELCPDEPMVLHAIKTEMKEDPFSPTAKAKVRVMIERKGGLFHASYEIIDSAGKVVLPMKFSPYDKCAIAVEHVGFSLSVHLPRLITGRTPPPRKPPPPPDPPLRSPPAKSARPVRWQADFGGLIVAGTSPGAEAAFGFWAHLAARRSDYSVALGVRYDAAPSTDGPDNTRVDVWRKLAEVVPCIHKFNGLVVCGLVQIGEQSLRYQARGIFWTANWPGVAAGVRAGGEWTLPHPFPPRLSVFLSAEMTASMVGRRLNLQGGPWRPFGIAAVGGGASVGYLFN